MLPPQAEVQFNPVWNDVYDKEDLWQGRLTLDPRVHFDFFHLRLIGCRKFLLAKRLFAGDYEQHVVGEHRVRPVRTGVIVR